MKEKFCPEWDPRSESMLSDQITSYDQLRQRCPVAHIDYLELLPREIDLLKQTAHQVAIAIENAFVYAEPVAVSIAVSLRGAYESLLPPLPRSRHHCLMKRHTRRF